MTGILLWQSSVLPFLLNNSSCWMEIKRGDMNRLIKLQNLFLNVLLGVRNCPAPLMLWDLKILSMPLQILKAKLILFHHIKTLSERAISYQVLSQQERFNLPSVFDDIQPFLTKYEVIDIKSFSKKEWALFVKKKLDIENREAILEISKKYKKLDHVSLALEKYEVKPYFHNLNLAQSRLKFRERSLTMNYCKLHFPSQKEFLKTAFVCSSCIDDDNEGPFYDDLFHWRVCSGYAYLRISRNLDDDHQLTNYYRDIIQLRASELDK